MNDFRARMPRLPVVARMSSLIEVMRLGGFYELLPQLRSPVTASRVNIDVTWSRDEVLVDKFLFHVSTNSCALTFWLIIPFGAIFVNYFEREVPPHPFWCVRLGEGAWAVQHRVRGARLRDLGASADMGKVYISSCLCCGIESIQRQYYPAGH